MRSFCRSHGLLTWTFRAVFGFLAAFLLVATPISLQAQQSYGGAPAASGFDAYGTPPAPRDGVFYPAQRVAPPPTGYGEPIRVVQNDALPPAPPERRELPSDAREAYGQLPIDLPSDLPLPGGDFNDLSAPDFGFGGAPKNMTVQASFSVNDDGRKGTLFVQAILQPGWHIYSQNQGKPLIATKITLKDAPTLFRVTGPFTPHPKPHVTKLPELYDDLPIEQHEGTVTWTAPIEFAPGVDPGQVVIDGDFYSQSCNENNCLAPKTDPFKATLGPPVVLPEEDEEASASSAKGSKQAAANFQFEADEAAQAGSIWEALLYAFLGGLILNIMPCVLPVVGLKVLAFFQQAGQNRFRAFMLNVWYAIGVTSVFLLFGLVGLGLGEVFANEMFTLVVTCIVFVMALSLMGLWEIQMPSFLSGSGASSLMQKEGPVGAIFKGMITTLLAASCGAPFLSVALAWVPGRSTAEVMLVFGTIGVGMSSPYLIVGAFPELLRFVPKPGEWMETFKKAMGYLLLTAVLMLLYILPPTWMLPTVGMLFALWFACWVIGRLPLTASTNARATAWFVATIVCVGTYFGMFHGPVPDEMRSKIEEYGLMLATQTQRELDEAAAASKADAMAETTSELERIAGRQQELEDAIATWRGAEDGAKAEMRLELERIAQLRRDLEETLEALKEDGTADRRAETEMTPELHRLAGQHWRPFDEQRFRESLGEDVIIVDFTSDWCLTCKTLEHGVLQSAEVLEFVDTAGVVTMQANVTDEDSVDRKLLDSLGGLPVPVIAVFSKDAPNRPKVFRGWVNSDTLIEALKQAGAGSIDEGGDQATDGTGDETHVE